VASGGGKMANVRHQASGIENSGLSGEEMTKINQYGENAKSMTNGIISARRNMWAS